MSSEITIRAENISKAYEIYRKPSDRLKQMFMRGKKKYYHEFWALKNFSIEIEKGETVGIIGCNGSGKSTLLQIVTGIIPPTAGSIHVKGRVAALLELGAGFNSEFTGRENVYLSASILGLSKVEIDERFQSIADFAGIGDFIEQPVKLYSSGMYARLAFSVAAHVDADVMIVDEILSVGDAAFTQKCMRFIHQFREKGTLLFVSHDIQGVINMCSRCVWLENGMVRSVGSPKDVCFEYNASLFQEIDSSSSFHIGKERAVKFRDTQLGVDHRSEKLKEKNVVNQIEVFDFNPDAAWFGTGDAKIESVTLLDDKNEPVSVMIGGEEISLSVKVRAGKTLNKPILGFYVKDRLGQELFGDNTYLTYEDIPVIVNAGGSLDIVFRFILPYLPTGDYSFCLALAEGTQKDHVQHHWMDDALFFTVQSGHVSRGLVGIPMLGITMKTETEESSLSI